MIRIRYLSILTLAVVLVILVEDGAAQPIWDRFTQLVFEPNRLNYWYNVWEKLFHLGRYHVHNLPKMLTMPLHGAHRVMTTVYNMRH